MCIHVFICAVSYTEPLILYSLYISESRVGHSHFVLTIAEASLVPRSLFSVFICGGGKRVWWISVGRFVLQTPRFWESLIGVDNYKGLFNEVSITTVACYVIK